jgi:hypothetical protein
MASCGIGTYDVGPSLNRFSTTELGMFTHLRHKPAGSASAWPMYQHAAFPIYEDRSGVPLGSATFAGFRNRLDRNIPGTFLPDSKASGDGNKRIFTLAFSRDRQGRFWLGSLAARYPERCYDRQTGTVTRMDAAGGQFPPLG